MAKDPAMLWYWGDWYSGTALMSRFLKGCYIDLLHAQFNNGRLSLEEIKTCLGSDFGTSWPTIQKKFKQDETGLFFNERLEQEKQKRMKYSESRRKNKEGSGKDPTYVTSYVKHMSPHMENENTVFNKNTEEQKKFSIEHCMTIALNDERWVKANKANEVQLKTFNQFLEQTGEYEKNPTDYKKHFANLKLKKPELFKPNGKTNYSAALEAFKSES